jgi:aryl-alcohol dehydrogenase-like predicted oxidoreductase
MPICAFTSQARGYFGAANARWATGGFEGDAPVSGFDSQGNRRRLLLAIGLAEQKGCTANQVALAYLLCQRAHVVPIISTSKVAHLNEAMAAQAVRLSPHDVQALAAA